MIGIKRACALLALGLLGAGPEAWAEVQVSGAWARATMPGQKVAGVYLELRSDTQASLVGARSDTAKAAEVHHMTNEGGVMRMRRVDALALPAGKTVVLEPGGYHLMLLEINRPLKAGEHIGVVLVIEQAGKRVELPVQAQVRSVLEEEDAHHK